MMPKFWGTEKCSNFSIFGLYLSHHGMLCAEFCYLIEKVITLAGKAEDFLFPYWWIFPSDLANFLFASRGNFQLASAMFKKNVAFYAIMFCFRILQ
jgi:hypothetical protein